MKNRIFFFSLLSFASLLFAQTPEPHIYRHSRPEGHYEGALIRFPGNSLLMLKMDFFTRNDSLFAYSNIPEWAYYQGVTAPVIREGNIFKVETYFGPVALAFDSTYKELVGELGESKSPLHLKSVAETTHRNYIKRPIEFNVEGTRIPAFLFTPENSRDQIACAIFVTGRGCSNGHYLKPRAAQLARFGIATVVFPKRGSEEFPGECDRVTMDRHAQDLAIVMNQTAHLLGVDPSRVGLITNSAGGWIGSMSTKYSETPPAFLVEWVGPSTSVQQQQRDCARVYTREELNGSDLAVAEAQEYTDLMFAEPNRRNYKRLQELLALSHEHGWTDVLDATDSTTTFEGYANLWAQRNQYDPAEDLKRFKGPFLAIMGEKDHIVPMRENVDRYAELFGEAGKQNWQVVVLPEADHGLEHDDREVLLERTGMEPVRYMKSDRVAAGAMQEIIDFLRFYSYLSE